MAPATDIRTSDPASWREAVRGWVGRPSLTTRILAVNVLALLLLAGGFFYLDSYRSRLIDSRAGQQAREAALIAEAVGAAAPAGRTELLVRLARDTETRLRTYDAEGKLITDTKALGLRNFALRDPDLQNWRKDFARFLDAAIDSVVGAARAPLYRERDRYGWPNVRLALVGHVSTTVWRAPDRTPVITAAAPLVDGGAVMTTVNARNITQTVRSERLRLAIVLGLVTLLSVLLSLFLARTIVRPIRRLAKAAVRVRLGRSRDVQVPRLPWRADELGRLARAVSDMAMALRERIDATEAFAADLAHELKNPLASLRSAVDSLGRVEAPELRAQLLGVVADDVRRLDRLITDISDASRLDAQLSRSQFEPLDLFALLRALIAQRATRGGEREIRVVAERLDGAAWIAGDGTRLERVFDNLIDNAVSFSPNGGCVKIGGQVRDDVAVITVDDEGPGVPADVREAIFQRFHSIRPDTEAFGRHSGLGLAIARTIVDAHGGSIVATDGPAGARFVVRIPLANPQ